MKYKIKQCLQIMLEQELNDEYKKGYEFKCKLFDYNTKFNGAKTKLITYLLERK